MSDVASRRNVIRDGARALVVAGSLPLIASCSDKGDEKDVGAVEDLMREHGILRRALMVYAACSPKLRTDPAAIDAHPLGRTATLFRDFGENYHEKKLEEAHIFPAVAKTGSEMAHYVDVLKQQHERGREITAYIIASTASGRVDPSHANDLARAFDTFVLMYENHAAREDTIIFQAWKDGLSASELDEMGDKFEGIEKAQFGGDGFEKAAKTMTEIELALGLADLSQFTAPAPPG